jgi:hypothetical protein
MALAASAAAQVDPLPVAPDGASLAPRAKAPAPAASAASAPEGEAATAPPARPQPEPGKTLDPLWELGAFAFDSWQPAYPGSATHLNKAGALPYAVYRGKFLRLEGGGIGVRAIRTPRYEWDLTGAFSFGGGANKVAARAGMPTIGTLAEAGPVLRINLGPLDQGRAQARSTGLALPLRAVFDLNDSFRPKGWMFEPTLSHTWWRTDFSTLNSSLGMLVGSRRMGDLFYGVSPEFATPDRPAYTAKGGLISTRLRTGLNLRITPTFRVYGAASIETVRGSANMNSPLVKRMQDIDLGIGFVWVFKQSEERASE